MAELPAVARFRFAREGSIAAHGKLPAGWTNENIDDLVIESIDSGPDGPAITLSATIAAANPAPFVSLVLGDYMPIAPDDVAAVRFDAEISDAQGVDGAFVILREWIAGGTYVGQATQPIAIRGGQVPAVAARMGGGDQRLLQPVLSFRRVPGTDGSATFTIRRLALASLHAHPAWLSLGR